MSQQARDNAVNGHWHGHEFDSSNRCRRCSLTLGGYVPKASNAEPSTKAPTSDHEGRSVSAEVSDDLAAKDARIAELEAALSAQKEHASVVSTLERAFKNGEGVEI